jgi:UDP-N-acetylmuramate: L-alanyl-gamma-D-glutamyl-meso-diaminopimelate ligase
MNLTNYYDFEKLRDIKKKVKKVFFFRICGTGMGSAACLLKEAGYEVEGTDSMFYPPMSTYIKKSGIPVSELSKIDLKEELKKYDLIVVGNVVARSSDDARIIEESGVPFCSFPAAIGAFILEDKKVIGLSGTHGKTTTTYLGLQVFENLGAAPGYLIGGVMSERPSASVGTGNIFLIESDEYDSAYFEKFSKFQSYSINDLVITSVEYDHADIFSSIDDIKNEFSNLIKKVNGVIACHDWEQVRALKESFPQKKWNDYGKETIEIVEQSQNGTQFNLKYDNDTLSFNTNVIGAHNIYNLSAVIIVALNSGYTTEQIQAVINNLKMVQRRQEVKGIFQGSPVIDDFAHHPTAVRETINAIQVKYPDQKINVYLEPGSATARSDLFQSEFVSALKGASSVVLITPQRATTAMGRGDLDVKKLVSDLNESKVITKAVDNFDDLLSEIKKNSNESSVQLVMSNSTCLGLWSSDFAKDLKSS